VRGDDPLRVLALWLSLQLQCACTSRLSDPRAVCTPVVSSIDLAQICIQWTLVSGSWRASLRPSPRLDMCL